MKASLPHFAVCAALTVPVTSHAQATGPAAQAAEHWFATDMSLGCINANGRNVACGAANGPQFSIFYGNADGGAGQPDAVAIVLYNNSDEGNGHFAVAGQFRQEGSQYRFIRKLPYPAGEDVAPGSQVRFGGGKAMVTILVPKPTDSRCCPTGRKVVAFSLR